VPPGAARIRQRRDRREFQRLHHGHHTTSVNSTYAYIDIDSATPVGPNDPGFTVTSNSCSFINIAGTGYNGQCSITVQFTPSVVGPESANLQVVAWSNTGGASGTQDLALTRTGVPVPCPQGTKANFRWHYSAGGSAGGWSGTTTQTCPGTFSMGPQAMEGNLIVSPGETLQARYDFTLPGRHNSLTLTASNAQVVFAATCVSGATPSASAFTVTMPAQSYKVTNDQWYPSGVQSSPLVYQGSVTVSNLCGGGQMSLSQGGTFTATLS
jgi:hypothetical protein